MMDSTPALDLTTCDREPIRIPGSIQPHGVLIVLDAATLEILQTSANAGMVLRGAGPHAGCRLAEVVDDDNRALCKQLLGLAPGPASLGRFTLQGRPVHASAHKSDGVLILELEWARESSATAEPVYPQLRAFVEMLQDKSTLEALSAVAAAQVREITGFDRVLVYRFGETWDGTVIAEDGNDTLPSYLDLRFPASDIPAQARELYRLNRLRIIPDAHYGPVPLDPVADPRTGCPTDLSFAALRSVSPVHLEYMRNMGTAASMSVSIMVKGELWGLISCHNQEPRYVPPPVRTACDFLGQIFALQLEALQNSRHAAHRVELQGVQSRLLAHMAAEENFVDGLTRSPRELLQLAGAAGAAVVRDGVPVTVGEVPGPEDLRRIVDWLAAQPHRDVVATECLSDVMPGAEAFKDRASGLLAISISRLRPSFLVWFRPEVIETVTWSGDPHKRVSETPDGMRLHPRRSFAAWKETVSRRAIPWQASEIETVGELRSAIVGIVLRKAEELAELAGELERSNKELEAFSYSVSHDLRAPFRHIVGFAELLRESAPGLTDEQQRYADIITESALSAGKLVDDLLSFSQMSRASLMNVPVDMGRLVAEVLRTLAPESAGRTIEWRIADLEPSFGDAVMLRQAWQNLISNAIKYTRSRDVAVIEICSEPGDGETVYFVRDNGIGFDMAYVGKLFGVFQRLHRAEDYEGTGIGLANVRRIIERHGGRAWAEGTLDRGAAFYVSLPYEPKAE